MPGIMFFAFLVGAGLLSSNGDIQGAVDNYKHLGKTVAETTVHKAEDAKDFVEDMYSQGVDTTNHGRYND